MIENARAVEQHPSHREPAVTASHDDHSSSTSSQLGDKLLISILLEHEVTRQDPIRFHLELLPEKLWNLLDPAIGEHQGLCSEQHRLARMLGRNK